ncbi:MAG: DUF5683 domain-containing protein [Flavobacteriaceae bacterium]
MPNKIGLTIVFIFGFIITICSQELKKVKVVEQPEIISPTQTGEQIDMLAPSKAAFYSAVLPGLGQAYNKKYWKIPIVYAALGTGVYFYKMNDNRYNRYRDAYKRRLAGYQDDEFYGDIPGQPRIEDDALIRAQKILKKNKEISILVTLGLYALNIIDANVDAHLIQFNVDENLTLQPHYEFNAIDQRSNVGLSLNLNF